MGKLRLCLQTESNLLHQAVQIRTRVSMLALVAETMRTVLRDPEATTAQRIYAAAVLKEVQYYRFVPRSMKYPGADAITADIKKKFDALQTEDK